MSGSSNGLHHPVALGIVLILVGAAMTVIGFVYGLSEVTGWPGPLMFAGLTAVPLGGALILWRILVRFRRSGWVAESCDSQASSC
jgi:cell division protein FtsW (lipid II flippase)